MLNFTQTLELFNKKLSRHRRKSTRWWDMIVYMLSSVPLKPFSVATLLAVHETNTCGKSTEQWHFIIQYRTSLVLTRDVNEANNPLKLRPET